MEFVDKYDNKKQPLNITRERYDIVNGEYKLTCHFWILNEKNELLIQQRCADKKVYPGLWSTHGGGVDVGETSLDTVYREAKEELGIDVIESEIELALSYRRSDAFVDVYIIRKNVELDKIIMQKEEVSDVKWITIDELKKFIKTDEFAPNIEIYFDLLVRIIENKY